MDCLEVIRNRFSVRRYTDAPVEQEKLDAILEAARLAPTACNLQPYKVVVIRTTDHLETLKEIYPRSFFTAAPYVLGVYANPSDAWSRMDSKNYADVDATIVMDHMILAAASLGLGTCWIGAFDPQKARDFAGLGSDWEPLAFTPVGYPDKEPPAKNRKPLDELVVYL